MINFEIKMLFYMYNYNSSIQQMIITKTVINIYKIINVACSLGHYYLDWAENPLLRQ